MVKHDKFCSDTPYTEVYDEENACSSGYDR